MTGSQVARNLLAAKSRSRAGFCQAVKWNLNLNIGNLFQQSLRSPSKLQFAKSGQSSARCQLWESKVGAYANLDLCLYDKCRQAGCYGTWSPVERPGRSLFVITFFTLSRHLCFCMLRLYRTVHYDSQVVCLTPCDMRNTSFLISNFIHSQTCTGDAEFCIEIWTKGDLIVQSRIRIQTQIQILISIWSCTWFCTQMCTTVLDLVVLDFKTSTGQTTSVVFLA